MSSTFAVTCLRNATVYGASPRMRFDLLVNALCGSAVSTGRIRLTSDGSAWRPFVHIEDVCEVIRLVLTRPVDEVSGAVLNVGDGDHGNWQVLDVARLVSRATGCPFVVDDAHVDERSYRIDTTRLNALGITCRRSLTDHVPRLVELLRAVGLDETTMCLDGYDRLRRLRRLRQLGILDNDLFWAPSCPA